ncbi:MAG: FecR family protein [bacterium]
MTQGMEDIISLLLDESFYNWLLGKASASHQKEWDAWRNRSTENKELYLKAVEFLESIRFDAAAGPDIDSEWNKLKEGLKLDKGTGKAIQTFSAQTGLYPQRRRYDSWGRFAAVACAATVLIALITWFDLSQKEEKVSERESYQLISTEYGQRATIRLPEGTKIVLNANSTLRYPAVWMQSSAHRFELQGEAYFSVAKSLDGPRDEFNVHTTDGTITVTGTRFVVYERGSGTRVVVEEGGVEVSSYDTRVVDLDSLTKIRLTPGHLVQFTKGKQALKPISVNINPFVTWWKKAMILEQTPFKDILQRLEETYGVRVKVSDKRLLKRTLSGSIENQNLVVVTDALANALKVPVRREGDLIIFGKSEVSY